LRSSPKILSVCGVNIKLYLPLACVALLSIGIAPSAAAEDAIEDLTEVSRSIAQTPTPFERPGFWEELPQLLPDRALGTRPELSLKKSPFARQKLETKQTAEDSDRPPNPQLTQNISDNDERPPHTQLTQNISDNDERRSTSIPNSPPAAALPSIPTAPIPKVGEIEQPSTSAQGLLRPSVPSFIGTDDDDTVLKQFKMMMLLPRVWGSCINRFRKFFSTLVMRDRLLLTQELLLVALPYHLRAEKVI